MKKLLLLALVAPATAATLILSLSGSSAKHAIEVASAYALGASTTIQSAVASPLNGELHLRDIRVANPRGYHDDWFLRLDNGRMSSHLRSFREDVVQVDEFTLDTISLSIERKHAGSNYAQILNHLKRVEAKGNTSPETRNADGTNRRFIIDSLTCHHVSVRFDWVDAKGEPATLDVLIPELTLTDVGQAQGGLSIGQITALLVKELLRASLDADKRHTPNSIASDLRKRLGGRSATVQQLTNESHDMSPEVLETLRAEIEESREMLSVTGGGS